MSMRPAGAATDMACSASERESAAEVAIVSATRPVMTCQVAEALRTGDAAMVLCRSMSVLLLSGQVLLDRGSRGGGQVVHGELGGVEHGLQPQAQRLEDELAHPAPVQAGRLVGDCRQARRPGQLAQAGEGLGQRQERVLQDLLHGVAAGQRHQDRGVGAGQERAVQRGGEVAGGDEEQVRVMQRALWSRAVRTALVARCTSAGFAASEASERATAMDSTSSRITTAGSAPASAGTYSASSSLTRCWDWPCSALISPCGLISMRRTCLPGTNGASWAGKPRARVVFPVPGGP